MKCFVLPLEFFLQKSLHVLLNYTAATKWILFDLFKQSTSKTQKILLGHSCKHSFNQSIDRSISQSVSQPTSPPTNQPISQPADPPTNQSIN